MFDPNLSCRCRGLIVLSIGLIMLMEGTLMSTPADSIITSPVQNVKTSDAFRASPIPVTEDRQGKKLPITDYHIHIRGGMTVEKAAAREEQSGIRSAVLENFGREWPLSDNATLKAFIDACNQASAGGKRLPVGIQVNDRDWFTQIDPVLFKRLDFVLADTMIMGVTVNGKPRRLWLPGVVIDDPETWMTQYLAHNLQILDEPISILANPTYLPPCIEDKYDELWTEARMRQVIAKAVEKGVALEIQAESKFPRLSFLRLAKSMGAKFSFGTNNFTDQPKDLSRWQEVIDALDLQPSDLWHHPQ